MKIMPTATVKGSAASGLDKPMASGLFSAVLNTLQAQTAPIENCRRSAAMTIHHRPYVGLCDIRPVGVADCDIALPYLSVSNTPEAGDVAF